MWQSKVIHEVFHPQAIPAFGIQPVDEADSQNRYEHRSRTNRGDSLLENICHVLKRCAIFRARGMKSIFWHKQHQQYANTGNTSAANQNWDIYGDIAN